MTEWIVFSAFVLIPLIASLWSNFGKHQHKPSLKESIIWCVIWVAIALLFSVYVWINRGEEAGLQYLTGYLLEKSLSVDNLFVFLLIFQFFKTPEDYIPKVLTWGVIGAVVMRGVFIALGATLVQSFHWVFYLFGVFLIITSIKIAFEKKQGSLHENKFIKFLKRILPLAEGKSRADFFVWRKGRLIGVTTLFLTLLLVEMSDVVFAIDSIPAIFAITSDPYIVFTSNIFAILGLRSLYYAISHFLGLFHHLHYALSVILFFVGMKILISDWYSVSAIVALIVVVVSLSVAVVTSLIFPKKAKLKKE